MHPGHEVTWRNHVINKVANCRSSVSKEVIMKISELMYGIRKLDLIARREGDRHMLDEVPVT